MRAILCLSVLLTSFAYAELAPDRAAIEKVISTLNVSPQSPGLFTADFNGPTALGDLNKRVSSAGKRVSPCTSGTVAISHEPFGEATWVPACVGSAEPAKAHPQFAIQSVRFVTSSVALVDASYDRIPVLLVMKKEKKIWRIASLRAIAQN